MSKVSEWLKGKADDAVISWVIATLIDFGKDLGILALQELGLALQMYAQERKTPDGWSELEYLTYINDRLILIEAQQLGNVATDKVCDLVSQWVRARIREKIEEKLPPALPN